MPLGLVLRSKAYLSGPSVRGAREFPPNGGGKIFASTRFLERPVGHDINIHGSGTNHYINMVDLKTTTEDAGKIADASKISDNNIIRVTKEHLNDVQKQHLAQAVDGFEAACL